MDTETLVENQINEGQEFLNRLVGSQFDVTAACWVKTGEEDRWFLFIVSKTVAEIGLTAAYRQAYSILRSLNQPWISMSDVKLITPDNPIASDILALLRRFPGPQATQVRRSQLGNMSIEEAYLYAPVTPLPRNLFGSQQVRLKRDVEQKFRLEEFVVPLTPQETHVLGQIVASGVLPAQAECLVRKRREIEREKPPIPAGTVVKAQITAWWGDRPEADPDPLLLVEAPDGAQGLTFKSNTEPV